MFIFFAKHFMATEAIKISVGMLNKSEFTVKYSLVFYCCKEILRRKDPE